MSTEPLFTPEFVNKLKDLKPTSITSGDAIAVSNKAKELLPMFLDKAATGLQSFVSKVAEDETADLALIGYTVKEIKGLAGLAEATDSRGSKTRRVNKKVMALGVSENYLVFRSGRISSIFGVIDVSGMTDNDRDGVLLLFDRLSNVEFCYPPTNQVKGQWASTFLEVETEVEKTENK